MNPEQAEYFNQLACNNSPHSTYISQSIVKINEEQLTAFIDQKKIHNKINRRAKTQTKQQKTKIENNTLFANNKQHNQQGPPPSIQQLVQQYQKLKRKYQNQLVDLRINKHLHEIQLKESTDTLHRLKTEKEIAMCTRKEQQLAKHIEELTKIKQQKIAQQQQQINEERQKKELIIQRLQKLQEYKNKRQEILSAKSLPAIPKYKLMEKKFVIQEIKNQLDKKVKSRHLKEMRYKNYIGLGSLDHSRINRINTELTKIKSNLKTSENMHLLSRQQLQQRKSQFLSQLQQKRRGRVVHIDKARELQIAILKDKEKNPLKYNFLKLKNLTQEQIFKDFQDFELDFDHKQLGNEYLQEAKLNIKHRNNTIKTQSNERAVAEKDLLDLSKNKSISNGNNSQALSDGKDQSKVFNYKQEIYKLLRNSQSKSKVVQLLSQQSSKKHKNMIHLREELQKSKQYQDCIKIEKDIDKDYLQFLKTKIVSLKLQTQP